MSPITREDLEPEVGGLFDDFDGTITDVRFEPNPRIEYQAKGGTDPGLTLVLDNPEAEEPIEQWFSCGAKKEWQVGRGGKEIVSGQNPELHRFNKSSSAGMLVEAMFETVGAGDRAKGQDLFLKRGHYMTTAEFYTGLGFHWKTRPVKLPISGEMTDKLLPNKFLGEVSLGVKAGTKGTAVAPAEAEDTEELDAVVIGLAEGKTPRQLKAAAVKDETLKLNTQYLTSVISGSKLSDLEQAEKLTLGPTGTYI